MKFSLIVAYMIVCCSCSSDRIWKDDELSINRTYYTGNQLKIDGYYYQKYGNPEKLTIYLFYENGTLLFAGDGYELSKLNEFEQAITSQDFVSKLHELKYCWGLFTINTNTIQFERWYPSQPPLKAYIRSGIILNDTTFQITKSIRSNGNEESIENEMFYFKKFSPKPDSTNSFVK